MLENRDVQGFIFAWLARAGLFVLLLPPDPLALEGGVVHRERIVRLHARLEAGNLRDQERLREVHSLVVVVARCVGNGEHRMCQL